MNYAHTDLLTHDEIHRDVDRVFRAFIDTSLLQFAKESEGNLASYWSKVVEFRRSNFGPLDREEFVELAGLEPTSPEEQRKRWALEQRNFKARLPFLCWLDVRAHYWSNGSSDKRLIEIIVPAEKLEVLYVQIDAVHKRLQEATTFDVTWDCRDDAEILEHLLATASAHARRRRSSSPRSE